MDNLFSYALSTVSYGIRKEEAMNLGLAYLSGTLLFCFVLSLQKVLIPVVDN